MSSLVAGLVALACLALSGCTGDARADGGDPLAGTNGPLPVSGRIAESVRVGVREDTRPFSYRVKTDAAEDILPGFGGYAVEICRQVLREMRELERYRGLSVRTVVVTAANRFRLLDNGDVDMLCGPNSVTRQRLDEYFVSHPIFLSGMTYAYVNPASRKFPVSSYCGNIVGVVLGTTAESTGLGELAESGLLLRFDDALDEEIEMTPERLRRVEIATAEQLHKAGIVADDWEVEAASIKRIDDVLSDHGECGAVGRFHDFMGIEHRRINREVAAEIETEECPTGFTNLPVRKFNNHDDGIEAFCKGEVLYYLGDYDIISARVDASGDCDVVTNRFTRTREMYGIFFRRPRPSEADLAGLREGLANVCDEGCADCANASATERSEEDRAARDLELYATFNNTLFRAMQGSPGLLERTFAEQFGESAESRDLDEFFQSFKIVTEK